MKDYFKSTLEYLLSYLKRLPIVSKFINKFKGSNRYKIKGAGNKIEIKGSLYNVTLDVDGNNLNIYIGEGSFVKDTLIFIRGDHHRLFISKNCYFGEGELWMEDSYGQLLISAQTTVERGHLAVTEPFSVLEIGTDCMLAKYVEIRTGDSHSIIDQQTGERLNKAANVKLQDHVWVGAHAKILKGVTVGSNSVIGTTSVVTKDVPPNSVVAGIPAKLVQSNINWKRERL